MEKWKKNLLNIATTATLVTGIGAKENEVVAQNPVNQNKTETSTQKPEVVSDTTFQEGGKTFHLKVVKILLYNEWGPSTQKRKINELWYGNQKLNLDFGQVSLDMDEGWPLRVDNIHFEDVGGLKSVLVVTGHNPLKIINVHNPDKTKEKEIKLYFKSVPTKDGKEKFERIEL